MKEIELTCRVGKEISEDELRTAAAKALGVGLKAVGECRLVRRSIDARGDVIYRCRYQVCTASERLECYEIPEYEDVRDAEPVIVAGAGPAGMFAALHLLMRGLKPVIIERGKDVHARKFDVAKLSDKGVINPDSNYCFGEGGAGTFSDGKLFTRSSKRGDIREVLHQFVRFGAPESILTDAHPHIGSDRLPSVVENIRKCIVEHGGEYHFDSRITDISPSPDGGCTVVARHPDGSSTAYSAKRVILATGHSARDIYELFDSKGWALEAKGFALGVRVEHPQSLINRIQYHGKYQPFMPTAEYSFVTQIEGRGVFSFCMCPGGILVPSSTEDGETVLNGMSNSARNSKWANSGVVVSVEPGDIPEYPASDPLSLMKFQRDVEHSVYDWVQKARQGGLRDGCPAGFRTGRTGGVPMPGEAPLGTPGRNPFAAPGQRMMDFCRGVLSANLPASSYHPGVISSPLHELLPEHVRLRLKYAFPQIGNRMRGYYSNDALLLGVESRTSSPVRIPRDPETLLHPDLPGLYPCGEGAGYSGGIVSSALDGINCAEKIAEMSKRLVSAENNA